MFYCVRYKHRHYQTKNLTGTTSVQTLVVQKRIGVQVQLLYKPLLFRKELVFYSLSIGW